MLGGQITDYDSIQLVQDLSVGQYDPLDYFGPESELIYSLQGSEIQVNTGTNTTYSYTDFGHLNEIDSDDFISLNLLNNQDAGNILSEWVTVGIQLGVDLNRDGEIDFSRNMYTDKELPNSCDTLEIQSGEQAIPTDLTTAERPYRFWLNNDFDVVVNAGVPNKEEFDCTNLEGEPKFDGNFEQQCELWDELVSHDAAGTSTSETNTSGTNLNRIENFRDLEDTFPVDMLLNKETLKKLASGDLTLKVKAYNFGLNLFLAEWEQETGVSHKYQFERSTAKKFLEESAQPNKRIYVERNAEAITVPKEMFQNREKANKSVVHFLAEGINLELDAAYSEICNNYPISCYLEASILKDNERITSTKIFLDLRSVSDFYDYGDAGNAETTAKAGEGYWEGWYDQVPAMQSTRKRTVGIFDCVVPKKTGNEDYIIHTHGWRMRQGDKDNFSQTAFKRLYWLGFQGRFAGFDWPTGWAPKPSHKYDFGSTFGFIGTYPFHYTRSEAAARRTGPLFAEWVQNMKMEFPTSKFHIVAHSMGNVMASEALRVDGGSLVTSYSAAQSAEVAGAYDSTLPEITDFALELDSILGEDFESRWKRFNVDYLGSPYAVPVDLYRFYNLADSDQMLHKKTSGTQLRKFSGDAARPYYAGLDSNTRMVTFYNLKDIALQGWETGQVTKPDNDLSEFFLYQNSEICQTRRIENGDGGSTVREWDDGDDCQRLNDGLAESRFFRHSKRMDWKMMEGSILSQSEIDRNRTDVMARIIPGRTLPVGRMNISTGSGSNIKSVRLQGTNSNQDHSMQYHGYLADNRRPARKQFWEGVLKESLLLKEAGDLSGLSPEDSR